MVLVIKVALVMVHLHTPLLIPNNFLMADSRPTFLFKLSGKRSYRVLSGLNFLFYLYATEMTNSLVTMFANIFNQIAWSATLSTTTKYSNIFFHSLSDVKLYAEVLMEKDKNNVRLSK